MKRKEATEILMKMAFRFKQGVGLGISNDITERDRTLITEAIETIWPYLYGRKITSSDWFSLPTHAGNHRRTDK